MTKKLNLPSTKELEAFFKELDFPEISSAGGHLYRIRIPGMSCIVCGEEFYKQLLKDIQEQIRKRMTKKPKDLIVDN